MTSQVAKSETGRIREKRERERERKKDLSPFFFPSRFSPIQIDEVRIERRPRSTGFFFFLLLFCICISAARAALLLLTLSSRTFSSSLSAARLWFFLFLFPLWSCCYYNYKGDWSPLMEFQFQVLARSSIVAISFIPRLRVMIGILPPGNWPCFIL